MACALTQGYTLDCADSYGGIKEIYLASVDDVTVAITAGVTTTVTKATGKRFYKYALTHQTSEVTESKTTNRETGGSSVAQTIKIIINKLSVSVRNELELVGKNRLYVVAVDNNGTGWLYGYNTGLIMTVADAKSGVKLADRNGYEITFAGDVKELAVKVDSTSLAALETAGS